MKVIEARNVHEALPLGLRLLKEHGIRRESRNGPVLQAPWPVCTVYERPWERVLFWPERDANPFFHLYESLWMLAGRNDVVPLLRYAKQMAAYSDDGSLLWGAYGFRWRRHFDIDQLELIAEALKRNPEDRRQVLQMWDVEADLGRQGKDLPCNLEATFQINTEGKLELTVFNRSNDIIWGAYGANAVHFSFLLEYMANWIGVPMGVYRQVSVNYHAYVEVFERTLPLLREPLYATPEPIPNPYEDGTIYTHSMQLNTHEGNDKIIQSILEDADTDFQLLVLQIPNKEDWNEVWGHIVWSMLFAHCVYKGTPAPERFNRAIDVLKPFCHVDWCCAGIEWIERRKTAWEAKS